MKNILNFAVSNIWNGGLIIWVILNTVAVTWCVAKTFIQKKVLEGTEPPVKINKLSNFFGIGAILLVTFVSGMVISLILFALSTVFVEYPMGGVIYKKDKDDKWIKCPGRVFHSLLSGGEETETIYQGSSLNSQVLARLSENSPFTVRYHVKEEDIPLYLKYIPDAKSARDAEVFIQRKSYTLFFVTSMDDLKDYDKRVEAFRIYYRSFGITVDSVDLP